MRLKQALALLQVVKHLSRGDVVVGLASVGQELPDGDPESPDVRLVSEYSVLDALQGQPLDRHLAALSLVFVLVDVQQLGKSEVGDLDAVGSLDKDVSGSKVAMHKSLLFQVGHSRGNLFAPAEQRLRSDLVLVVPDILQETTERHQLGDQHESAGHADGQKLQEVRVLDACHDVGLLQDLLVGIFVGAFLQLLDSHRDLDILALGYPDALVDGSESSVTEDATSPQLVLLDDVQLGQVGLDVGRLKGLVVSVSGHDHGHLSGVLLGLGALLPVVAGNGQQKADDDDR